MERDEFARFLQGHSLAVVSSLAGDGRPQAALVGVAHTEELELVFDTLSTARKAVNLRADPRIALVMGTGEITAQLEGTADFPEGAELDRVRDCYLAAFPDGRGRATSGDITYVRVRLEWLRYSDYTRVPPVVVELASAELSALLGRGSRGGS